MSNDPAKPEPIKSTPALTVVKSLALTPQTQAGAVAAPIDRPAPPLDDGLANVPGRLSRFWIILSFIIAVLLPTLGALYALTQVFSDRYTSELRVAVRSSETPIISGLGGMLGLPGSSGASYDAQALVQYLQSRGILEDLRDDVDVPGMFGGAQIDWFSRLPDDASMEDLLKRWNSSVKTSFEGANNTVVVRATTFSPQHSLDLSNALLAQADEFVNTLTASARRDAVLFAEREVGLAEDRLTNARVTLAELQDREALLDPVRQADATMTLLSELRGRLAAQRAILATQLTQLGPEAPSVRATKNLIAGLEQEVRRLDSGVTSTEDAPSDNKPLTELIREYQAIADELEYAQLAYTSALTSLEAARIDADRNQIYLATVVRPALAEEESFPKPLNGTLLVLTVSFALWLIGLLGTYAVRDHL